MKRPSVLSQEKPRGQWGSGLVACGDPREGEVEGEGQRPSASSGQFSCVLRGRAGSRSTARQPLDWEVSAQPDSGCFWEQITPDHPSLPPGRAALKLWEYF